MIRKLAAGWLEFEAERILKRVLPEDSVEESIRMDKILSTGHRRKILVTSGDRKYVCQLALRRGYCRTLSELHNLARANHVPVAPVLGVGTCWRGVVPVYYIVLDWMYGSPCNKDTRLDLHQLTELGRIFGHLHSIDSDQWINTDVKYPRQFDDIESMQDAWTSLIQELSILEEERSNNVLNKSAAWMNQNSKFLKGLSKQNLVHGDAHGNNVVVKGDQLFLIDTDQMLFSVAPFELFRCLLANYNEYNLERQSAFLRGYHEAVDLTLWRMWKEHMAFIAATVFLKLAKQKLIRSQSLDDSRRKFVKYRRATSYWNTFLRLTKEQPRQIDNLQRIMAIYREVYRETQVDKPGFRIA